MISGSGEFISSSEPKTGIIETNVFQKKAVKYSEIEGRAIFEGDIDLGSVLELQQRLVSIRDGVVALGTAIKSAGDQYRWKKGVVPFEIVPDMPMPERIQTAIEHWQAKTKIKFISHTNETDYVIFRLGEGCSSQVGRRGAVQYVTLGPQCSAGNAIHEIGHTIGLWHEQSREDRDAFVSIDWGNILAGFEHNFDQHVSDGDDIGAYDYGSIMHYPANAFARDASRPTIVAPPGSAIGQRNGLSAGDISAVAVLYP